MPMEERLKSLSPQNTFGISGVNSVAALSNTIEVNGDHFFKQNKRQKKTKHASILLLWCHPSVRKPRHSNSTLNGRSDAIACSDANAHPACAHGQELVCSLCVFPVGACKREGGYEEDIRGHLG